jgi:hypothetical protein
LKNFCSLLLHPIKNDLYYRTIGHLQKVIANV